MNALLLSLPTKLASQPCLWAMLSFLRTVCVCVCVCVSVYVYVCVELCILHLPECEDYLLQSDIILFVNRQLQQQHKNSPKQHKMAGILGYHTFV